MASRAVEGLESSVEDCPSERGAAFTDEDNRPAANVGPRVA